MLKRIIAAFLITATGTSAGYAEPNDVPGWLVKDFGELTGYFEGRWDSDRHAFFAEAADLDLSTVAPRQHLDIKRLDVAEEGQAVFEAERTVEGEPAALLIHSFAIDPERLAIRQTIARPGGSLTPLPLNCDILWRRDGAQFRGVAEGEGCPDVFPRPLADGQLQASMTLSADEFWVTSARGDEISEARLRRARPFECWTAILRGASHGDSGEGMRDWDFRRGVKIHDQGGEVELITDEEEPRTIRLRLRNVDWPYGTNRPSLTLYVLEGDSDRAVSYAWNEGNAERIGINLRWIQASCTHTPVSAD